MSEPLIVLFDAEHVFKAYHDPERNTIEVVSSQGADEGASVEFGPGFELGYDEDGVFRYLLLDLAAAESDELVEPRPAEAPVAQLAELEVTPGGPARFLFDPVAGTLCVRLDETDALDWARVGPNLLWLAIDDDARIAAIVIEGVSRDPGGHAQAAWLADMGAAEL